MNAAQLEALERALLETNTPDSAGTDAAPCVTGKLEAKGDRMALLIFAGQYAAAESAAREWIALRGVQVPA
jgi:hypothetical protein